MSLNKAKLEELESTTIVERKLRHCAELFESTDSYHTSSQLISYVVSRDPMNNSFQAVYEKTVLINTLYSTVVYDTIGMARHILRTNIDSKLESGDISVIGDIRAGHGIRTNRGKQKEIDFYSFATKYAAFHRPDVFPLYDDYVKKLLWQLNKIHKFTRRFTQTELRKYPFFKEVIDSLATLVNMEDCLYEELDHALWLYGKYIDKQGRLDKALSEVIRNG